MWRERHKSARDYELERNLVFESNKETTTCSVNCKLKALVTQHKLLVRCFYGRAKSPVSTKITPCLAANSRNAGGKPTQGKKLARVESSSADRRYWPVRRPTGERDTSMPPVASS